MHKDEEVEVSKKLKTKYLFKRILYRKLKMTGDPIPPDDKVILIVEVDDINFGNNVLGLTQRL